jgi:hypothetical protein
MKKEIAGLFPGCPPRDVAEIAAHTAARGSGRVGRTAAGRSMDEGALTAAVAAAIRHRRTNYDELLALGLDRDAARERVRDQVEEILADWRRVQ